MEEVNVESQRHCLQNKTLLFCRLGLGCSSTALEVNHLFPAYSPWGRRCGLQQEPLLFSCAGSDPSQRRLCPCRAHVPGQVALCPDWNVTVTTQEMLGKERMKSYNSTKERSTYLPTVWWEHNQRSCLNDVSQSSGVLKLHWKSPIIFSLCDIS